MRPTVLVDRLLRPALQVAGLGALAWSGRSARVEAFPLAWAAPYLPSVLLAGWALRRLHRAATRDAGRGRYQPARIAWQFWRFSAPRAFAGVAQLALQRLDILLVAALAGLPAAAVYTVAGRFVVLGQFVNQAVSQVVQPRLAERLAVDDRGGARELYRRATGWLVLLTWPLYLLVAAYTPVYLGLFGREYRTGGPVVVLLAAAMLVGTACGMVDMVLAMAGRTSWNLANVVLALAVTLTVDLPLVPRLGAFGAALGLAAAVCVNNLVPLAQIGYALGLHPFGRVTLAAAGLAVACFGVPALAVRVAVGERPAALAAVGAAATAGGVAVYVAVLLRQRDFFGLQFATSKGGSR
jgi:O-antigen/teichoic acid export membrane protein